MTRSVLWTSCQRLSCASAQTPDVVICLASEGLVVSPDCSEDSPEPYIFHTIEATLTKTWRDDTSCGVGSYRYLLSYNENDLTDPTTPLTSAQVSGVFCKGCLTTWIEDKVGDDVTLVDNEDGTLTLTNQHGCTFTFQGSF